MSSPKVNCDVSVLGDRNVIPQEDVSGAARIRKSKKPEIQIYRPGALRQKRSSVSNEHLISVTHEENTTKPVSTKKDVKDNGKKSLVQGKQGLLQEQKMMKEDRAIDSATKHKETVNKYIKKGRESHVEVNVDSSKKIRKDTQYCEEMHASECHAKEKEKPGFGTSKEQVKLSNAAEDVRIKVQLLSENKFSATTNIRSDSHKDGNNTHEKQEETKSPADVKVTCVQSMNKQDESKSSAGKSVSNIPVVTLPEKGSCSSFDSANSGKSKTEVNCKLLKENNAKVGAEKYLSRKNSKSASEKNPLKKDSRGSLERASEIKTRSANHGKSLIDTVSVEFSESLSEKNKWYDHNEGSRENRRVNDGKKESENNEQNTTENGENPACDRQQSRRNGASECDKSRRKKDTWCNKNMVNRMPFKKPRENDGKTGFDKQHKRDGNSSGMSKNDRSYRESYDYYYTKSENYKGKKASYSKNEHINESCNQVLKSRTKLNSGYCQTNEKYENKEENPITVSELAAKVDELAVSKLASKKGSSRRKGKGWPDNSCEGKEDFHGIMKGSMREEKSSETKLEPSDKALAGNEKESKCAVSNIATPEFSEKSPRVKSYSNVRENRKNRGNKSLNLGKIHSTHQEEIKIQVTINRNSHERTSSIRLRSESDTEEFESKSQNTQGVLRNRNKDEVSSLSQKHSSSMKSKSVGYGKTAQDINVPEFKDNPGEFDMEHDVDQMTFIDVPDDLIDEVDRDMSWCNQHVGGTKTPTWEDEKSTWKGRRDKHSENEDQQRRVESPGRRAGLIQLSTTVSGTDNSGSEPAVSHQLPAATQQLQKHLYNPHNPSKPVLVVPSARDLPVSRDPHREVGRGFGDSITGSLLAENSNISEYAVEGRNPKIDPSLLYNIQKGEMDINYYVSSNQLPVEFRRIMDIRHHLQGCYKQLLTSDIRMCQEKNVEGCLWKTLYYVIIEKLREYISRDPTLKDRSLSTLLMLVDEGQRYLQDLLEALQREYGFTLEDHLEEEGTSHTEIRGKARIALMSAQKLLLSLGDLARYREQYSSTPNFNLAKKWYQMALQVHPRNGRPFNQLAIIAVNQKRPLDVVYYYIRSLTASNPFMSARDSLVSMFDDIRKKYISAQHNEPRTEGMQTNMGRAHHCEGLRQEIWIRPDSGATHRRTLSQSTDGEGKDEENELKKIPLEQLMKRFLTSYLHCHGMLFSRVGLDGFRECCVTMMQEFCVLLRSSPPRLSTNHLLQIMAINMYAVSNTELKDARVGSGYRSAAQELALVLAQEMFGGLVQLVVELLPHHVHHLPHHHHQDHHHHHSHQPPAAVDPHRLFSPTLAYFMPPLKAWCDWLLYHSSVWNPPPPALEYCFVQGRADTWRSVAELATIMRGFGAPDVTLTEASTAGGGGGGGSGGSLDMVPLKLTEDAFLRGYEPLLPAHATVTYAALNSHTGRACDWARVTRLQTCLCQFLCGVDPPVLRLQKTDQGDVLVSIVDTSPPDTPTAARLSFSASDVEVEDSLSESDASEVEEDMEVETAEDDTPLASTVKLLTHRKKVLERKQRQQRKLQSLLEGSVTLEMEVRPRYLVPDTNCFIEHLDVVQALVNSAPYTVMVPLVVLNELDGLSRDAAVAKYGSVGHAVRVREGAAAALHYLRDTKPQSLKCVTSQGSVLSSTTFTAEIDMLDATNDDKILSCCVHFCSDTTQRRPIRAGVRRLYREVVLLTEDRNLRVKAHARDVPVRDLLDFAHWAGVR